MCPFPDPLQALAEYASNPGERAELLELGSLPTEAKQRLIDRVFFRNFAEVLDLFPSVRLRWEDAFCLLPALKSRYYSISSSPLVDPNSVHLTVGRLLRSSPDGTRQLRGLASNYLCDTAIGGKVDRHLLEVAFWLTVCAHR